MNELFKPANSPAWLPDYSRSIVRAIMQAFAPAKFTVANLPDAPANEGRSIYVSDETGGPTLAFSDGTDWRRTSDNAIVS